MNKRLILCLSSLSLISSACAGEPARPAPAPAPQARPAQQEFRSPGKPSAPLTITSDLQGPVEGGTPHAVRISLQSLSNCDSLATSVYGTRGVEVQDGAERSHGAVSEGAQVEHAVRAQVPAGVAGRVVVRATCRAGGQERQSVETFLLAAKGAAGESAQIKPHGLGELTTDDAGRPIRVMPSTPPRK